PDSLSHLSGEPFFAAHIAHFRNTVHPDDLAQLDAAYVKSVKERTPFDSRHRLQMPDGRIKYVHERGETLYDSDGTPLRSIGTVQDVTERTLVEQELAAYRNTLEAQVAARTAELLNANEELEAFAYSVSHDLRAPLRAIHGFSQILQEDYGQLLGNEGRDYLQRVRANAKRMGELIDDLLGLSRISRHQLDIGTVSLTDLAQEISENLQRQNPEREARFEIQAGVSARGDISLLRIMLVNLLGNAWKYTSKSDDVQIHFGRCRQDGVQAFFVRDNGAGFDSQYASQLFMPFQRLHTENEFEGTGIGLATVQRIIQRHGGRIWAESLPGKGATFYFTLDPD
ncbi:MAG TPA: PAS domain-containing sensor histidine kinase, partial [Gammaproteobacteria bacterium]|nr:PAS domain-containing sensor histidine kinase [Gammaproteobacteria bacterium]